MDIFSRLFSRWTRSKHSQPNSETVPGHAPSAEALSLLKLSEFMNHTLAGNEYRSKRSYRSVLEEAKPTIDFFAVLERSGVLEEYCRNNGVTADEVHTVLRNYNNFESLVDAANEQYVKTKLNEEKDYLNGILRPVDPKIILDEDQRKVILTDEDYCLVIAGAGAGKTTTVAAKVRYLTERKGIDPRQILVISFTNKAVQELRDKINRDLAIPCPIATFHSTGNAIIHKQSPEKLNIVQPSKLYDVILDYFRTSVLTDESLVNNLILFFASYFDAPFEGKDLNKFFSKIARSNFSTMRSDLDEYKRIIMDSRSKKAVTIQNEFLRSYQEVEIANFLYLNGIDYEYEPIYKYDIQFSKKPYTPDFLIRQGDTEAYLEHFGITEDGRNSRYSNDQLNTYKKSINDKILLHRKHKTNLIYTFSEYRDHRSLTDHLKEQLERKGFILVPRSNREIMEKLVTSEENRYIRKLVSLITRFITNFKTNGYTASDFTRMYQSTQNVRSRLFLTICNDCYLEYERILKENNAVDFQDMINESARILREVRDMHQKLDFRYIIVDEYQDISRQRFDLVTALSEVTDAKIIAVGDDWQSIYAFSGSDITLFTRFAEKMGYAKLLKIVRTYRNSQEVIDIAGDFIQKNDSQIRKGLISPKRITDPVIIYTYDGTRKKSSQGKNSGVNYEIARAVEIALSQIIAFDRQEGKDFRKENILLLGRFGFDGDHLEKSGLFEFTKRGSQLRSVTYPFLNITVMTAHASKGLGYDNVIVINGKNETYGFPSKIEDDPVLSFVIREDHSYEYAEERRLFYVAMTRTKNRVYFLAPQQNPSEFLLEIKKNYKNVVLKGSWNENSFMKIQQQKCPICGYPLQFRYKNSYGLRLWICTNEPELCGFMTNEYKAGKLAICKCDQCRDGYLIVKPAKGDYFLGCTNYRKDKTGCSRTMTRRYYYSMMNYPLEEPEKATPVKPFHRSDTSPSGFTRNPAGADGSISVTPAAETCTSDEHTEPEQELKKNVIDCSNPDETATVILSALTHISANRYYGITVLADLLRGSYSTKMKKNYFTTLPEYGALHNLKRETIIELINWMISVNLIRKTNHPKYPVLHSTPEGMTFSGTLSRAQRNSLQKALTDPELFRWSKP